MLVRGKWGGMGTRDFTLSLPDEIVTRMQAGELDEVAAQLTDAVRQQVRREAIQDYLAACETAAHAPLTDSDLREFRKLVGEEPG